MVGSLAQHQAGPTEGGPDVALQVGLVDLRPDALRLRDGLLLVQRGVAAEVGLRVAERRLAQPQETLDVPVADVGGRGVDVDREVDEVAHRDRGPARGLQHVEALEQEDVGPAHDLLLVGEDVVDEVRVHRRGHLGGARLDRAHELQQRAAVVGLGEALAGHQPAPLQLRVGAEEPVGRDQLHARARAAGAPAAVAGAARWWTCPPRPTPRSR